MFLVAAESHGKVPIPRTWKKRKIKEDFNEIFYIGGSNTDEFLGFLVSVW